MDNDRRVAELQRELDELKASLTAPMFRVMALASALRRLSTVLIASHPNPTGLHGLWDLRRAGWIEEDLQEEVLQSEDFRESYLDVLGQMTSEIERAAGR